MFTVSKTYQTLRSITDLKEVNKRSLQTFFEHKNGILQNHCQITTSPRQLIIGRDIFMSTILQMKSISKRWKNLLHKNKSRRQLILGRNILNVHHTKSGKYIQRVKELRVPRTYHVMIRPWCARVPETNMSCPVVDLTKILKVITNGNVHPHFGFLIDTIKIDKKWDALLWISQNMKWPLMDLIKYWKSLRMELYVFILASLLIQ
jgi:hypothetical protein